MGKQRDEDKEQVVLLLRLTSEEYNRLKKLADRDLRSVEDEAHYILREGIRAWHGGPLILFGLN